jgi:predicted AlkP superfamily phosphohydrolase/phosphomutase
MDIGSDTKAFALDPSRLYINLKDKYPSGKVESSDYDLIRYEIKDRLETLTAEGGNRVIKKVFLKEELYTGPYLIQAPDLVLLSFNGYDLKGKVNSSKVFGRSDLEGMHTQDDAFFYNNSGIELNSIFEAKKTIINSFLG